MLFRSGFANLIIQLYEEFFGEAEFKWLYFNSNPKMWGQIVDKSIVHGPGEIPELRPDFILICSYSYDNEIFESLRQYEKYGVRLEKLHRDGEVPWVF